MPAPRHKAATPAWAAPIEAQYWLQSLLRLYPTLNVWVIRGDGRRLLHWWQLTAVGLRPEPYHFEPPGRTPGSRYLHQLRCFKKVTASRRPWLAEWMGFHDLAVPLPGPAGRHAILFAGQFSLRTLDEAGIRRCWQQLTGHAASPANPSYTAFARAALGAPVFEGAVLQGMRRVLEACAAMAAGRPIAPGFHEAARALHRLILSRHLPHPSWSAQALDPEKSKHFPWTARQSLEDYEKEELGITRVPTTVLALMPRESARPSDVVAQMVRNAALQRCCFRLAKDLPETLGEAMGDYGALFLSSAQPGLAPAAARQELRARAEAIRARLRQDQGVETVVAIGPSVAPGETLAPSQRGAMATLHHCLAAGRGVMFYDEIPGPQKLQPLAELQQAAARLAAGLETLESEGVLLAAEAYVQRVLNFAATRPELARACFLSMMLWLLEVQKGRGRVAAHESEAFLGEFYLGAEEVGSVFDLAALFRERVHSLLREALPGPAKRASQGLARALDYLAQNYQSRLGLKEAAKQASMSVTAFSLAIKQATGTTFVAHLRGLRLEHARKLLRSSPLSVEEVAQLSGFRSARHFSRVFRAAQRQSPQAYRRSQAAAK